MIGTLADIDGQWLYWRDCKHKVARKSHGFQNQQTMQAAKGDQTQALKHGHRVIKARRSKLQIS